MKALGSYIFAGGFTLGVMKHFDVEAVLETSDYGVPTFRHNVPEVPVCVGSDKWRPFLEERGVVPGSIPFIYGNPPCAAWSNAGAATKKGRSWRDSPLVACTEHHFGLLEEYRPRVWAWESVQRAWQLGEEFVRSLADRAAAIGYSTTILLHNAEWFGVPQRRKRFFMVCHDVEFNPRPPLFQAGPTIDEVLRGINDPGEPLERNLGKFRHLLPHMKGGENASSCWMRMTPEAEQLRGARGQMVGRPPFTIKRARSGGPAPVVMHELVHPTEHRGLSIKELAILTGYPATYEFIGANDAGQVGRGVCPPVGEYLAREVKHAIEQAGERRVAPTIKVVDYTDPPGSVTQLSFDTSAPQVAVSEPETDVAPPPPAPRAPSAPAAAHAFQKPPGMTDPKPKEGVGSGAYMRMLLMTGWYDVQSILRLNKLHFPSSVAGPGDVAFNRAKLRAQGLQVPGYGSRGAPPATAPAVAPAVPDAPPAGVFAPDLKGRVTTVENGQRIPNLDTPGQGAWLGEATEAPVQELAPEDQAFAEASADPSSFENMAQHAGDAEEEPETVEQPKNGHRENQDAARQYDKTSLRANSHGQWIHRDYLAHAFRWAFAGRFVNGQTELLDVGCGPDIPMINVLTMPRNQVPKRYVGVDYNRKPLKHPTRQWATIHWQFDFMERYAELGQFDLVTNFEVIEHMHKPDGIRLLNAMRECVKPTGLIMVSTPVFNGKAAANHIHEWTIPELAEEIDRAGLEVAARYGTFASQRDIQKVASAEELAIAERLSKFYSGEVMATFLAPLYPDASRNNIWVLRRKK